MRIDEEQRKDLPTAWFTRVFQSEGLNLVLEDVGKGEQAPFAGVDSAYELNAWVFSSDAEDDG